MKQSDNDKDDKLDKKAVGIGLATATAVLTLLQSNGIHLMNAGQERKNAENTQRLTAAEIRIEANRDAWIETKKTMSDLQLITKSGFMETNKLLMAMTADRFTKSEHQAYQISVRAEREAARQAMQSRLQRIEDDLRLLEHKRGGK